GVATQINSSPIRLLAIFNGQLYGDGDTGNALEVFTVGNGLPTAPGTAETSLPGFPTSGGPSPWAFVMFDLNPAVPGLDALYLASDRVGSPGMNGIQKWTFDGSNWTLSKTLNLATPVGFRHVTGLVTGSNVTLVGSTVETANRLILFVDDGSANP